MAHVDLYNADGTVLGKRDLPEAMFGRKWNPDLVHQVITALESNERRPVAHAKGRGEVRGGGRKPWRQKGTGRARHGSIRSPLWAGGGVTHGPTKERNFKKKVNKKMRRAALFSALSRKVEENELRVVRSFDLHEPKTKDATRFLAGFLGKSAKGKVSALLVPGRAGATVRQAIKNVPGARSASPEALNARDVLRSRLVMIEEPALETMEKTFLR